MSDILIKHDGPILRIALNRPERGNAVSDEMVAELTGVIESAEKASSASSRDAPAAGMSTSQ